MAGEEIDPDENIPKEKRMQSKTYPFQIKRTP